MSQYKYDDHLVESNSWAFDQEYKPGQPVTNPGIYRCKTCGDEVVCDKGAAVSKFHHEHTALGPVMWKLLVFAQKHPSRS
jgi:hypothetical protein